jgi:small subunit ribosomal protein S21
LLWELFSNICFRLLTGGHDKLKNTGARNLKEIQVKVIDNDIEKAMRILKKKIQNDGLFKRLKLKKSYEKPSEYRRRKMREALRRERIAAAKARHRR